MKRYLYILTIMLSTFMLVTNVKAETYDLSYPDYYLSPGSSLYEILNYDFLFSHFEEQVIELYDQAFSKYNTDFKSTYPYYFVYWDGSFKDSSFNLSSIYYDLSMVIRFSSTIPTCTTSSYFHCSFEGEVHAEFKNNTYSVYSSIGGNKYNPAPGLIVNSYYNYYYFSTLDYFMSNFDIYIPSFVTNVYNFSVNNQNYSLSSGDIVPQFYNSVYPNDIYTTVNLDNYEYVLLTLKDYTQTDSFSSNLAVKGQIGITPIYNYGQTSKDNVIGYKVSDRCNVSYSDYTDYRVFITDTDLFNNAIYAVKACSEGSSFKFDNTVFDITYVTEENKDDPIVTINGKTYHTIPYDSLPSTATKNEEEGFIPGASENAVTGNTVGLSAILKNIQQKMSDIWNVFSYFTGFINQLFSVLPVELKTILVSAFAISIVLGLIKIFVL